MSNTPDLSPREAWERWQTKLYVQKSDGTADTYYYHLKLFVEWAEANDIDTVSDLTGWDLEKYEMHRREQNPTSVYLNNEFGTIQNWFEYLARIDVADENLPDKVKIPDVKEEDKSSDVKLSQDAASQLLQHYRSDSGSFGTREHVLLELVWHTGARANGIVALDLRDMRETEEGDRYLAFTNRPETGTRLKKGNDGERPVRLSDQVWAALDHYVENYRFDVYDDHGRQPLLASKYGRPVSGTIRDWMYLATIPCRHSECPHERDPDTCEYTRYQHASGCPSSRSPHQVRTGAITWMLNCGKPAEIVAERVNSSVETIEEHYDKEEPITEMIERRDPYFAEFDIDEDSDHE